MTVEGLSIKLRAEPAARLAGRASAAVMALLLFFWAVSLWNLDRFPPLHNDESTILAPGYKLFTQGVYGLDMYTGFYRQEQIYLEVPPLMSLLQGASAWLIGVGVWQARLLPAALGAVTLSLSYAIARDLLGTRAGLLSALVLLFWRWTPGGLAFLGSGLPLVDVSRLARYDILVAPLGLAAFWLALRSRGQESFWMAGLSGALAGLGGLANVYGLFWVPALMVLAAVDQPRDGRARRAAAVALGAAAVLLPWALISLANWSDLAGQFVKHNYDGRFDVLDPAFYLDNLANEIHRYHLGARSPSAFGRLGFWMVVAGLPAAVLWAGWRSAVRRDWRARWLLVPCLVIPILLGLLVNLKRFYYLIAVIPLFACLLAWGWDRLLASRRRGLRLAANAALALMVVQGALGIAQMQAAASRVKPPHAFYSELRQAIPAGAQRIYGPHEYWFGLYEREYRGFVLPLLLSRAQQSSYAAAMRQIAPEVVLLNPYLTDVLSRMFACGEPPGCAEQFWTYMEQHHARLIGEIVDHEGRPVQIYLLEP